MLILSLYSVEIVNDSSLNFTPDNYGLFLHTEASPRPVLTQTQRLYAPSQGCGKKISTPWQQFNNSSDTLNIYNPCHVPVQLNHSGTNTEQAIKDSSGYVVTHSSDTRENSPDKNDLSWVHAVDSVSYIKTVHSLCLYGERSRYFLWRFGITTSADQ